MKEKEVKMKTNHERIKMLSNLAYSLCKKFEMNPYVVSLYPEKPEITIQGKHSSKTEEKLTREGYELIRPVSYTHLTLPTN